MFLKEFDFSLEMQKMKRKYRDGLLYYGLQGEERVAFELNKIKDEGIFLYNVRLLFNGEKVQIDFVVIYNKKIYLIEVKNLYGNLVINEDGSVERHIYKDNTIHISGMNNPFLQLSYQKEIIRKIIKDKYNYDIETMLVMANDKMVIKNYSSYKNVYKYDELIGKIKQENSFELNEDDYVLANYILKFDKTYNYGLVKIIKDNIRNQYVPDFDKYSDLELYLKILDFRKEYSNKMNMPICNVFNNKEAELLVKAKPVTKEEFVKIKGFKEKRYEMYGEELINIFTNIDYYGIL